MRNKTQYDFNLVNQRHQQLAAWLPDGKSVFARFEDGGEGQPAGEPAGGEPATAVAGDPPIGTPAVPAAAAVPATPASPPPAANLLDKAGLVNADGTFVADWHLSEDMSEDVRGSKSLAVIKNLNDLAKRTVHAEKMIGKNKIAVPKAGADQTEWDAFQAAVAQANPALKVPDTAADYKFDIPDGMESVITDERLTASKELAKAVGVTQAQFEQFMAADLAQAKAAQDAAVVEQGRVDDANELALKKEWGEAYPERQHIVKRLIAEAFGTDSTAHMEFLEEFGGNPAFVRFAAVIGSRMVESNALVASLTNSTPTEALKHIADLRATPGYMQMSSDMTAEQRTDITAQIRELHKEAYPTES